MFKANVESTTYNLNFPKGVLEFICRHEECCTNHHPQPSKGLGPDINRIDGVLCALWQELDTNDMYFTVEIDSEHSHFTILKEVEKLISKYMIEWGYTDG